MYKYRVIYKNAIYRVIDIEQRPCPNYKENEVGIKKTKGMVGILALNEDGELINILDEAWMFKFIKGWDE